MSDFKVIPAVKLALNKVDALVKTIESTTDFATAAEAAKELRGVSVYVWDWFEQNG
ncbi:MAG: hypothetical protein OXC91_05615 [Rhodobacteraceae bacterium]|nr:hypothetical protein [Paracoccaceae bacterium]